MTSSAIGSVFQTSRPLSASKAKIAEASLGGDDHQAVVDDRRVQVAVAAPAPSRPSPAGDRSPPSGSRRSRPRARPRRRGWSGSRGSGRRARAGGGRSRRRRGVPKPMPHRHEVVDLRGRGPQVADPAASAGLGVEAGDVGRRLLAPVGHGHVDVPVVGHRRPLEVDRPVDRSAGRLGRTRSLGLLLPEQLALGRPVERDDGARGRASRPGSCPCSPRESAAPIRA